MLLPSLLVSRWSGQAVIFLGFSSFCSTPIFAISMDQTIAAGYVREEGANAATEETIMNKKGVCIFDVVVYLWVDKIELRNLSAHNIVFFP